MCGEAATLFSPPFTCSAYTARLTAGKRFIPESCYNLDVTDVQFGTNAPFQFHPIFDWSMVDV